MVPQMVELKAHLLVVSMAALKADKMDFQMALQKAALSVAKMAVSMVVRWVPSSDSQMAAATDISSAVQMDA